MTLPDAIRTTRWMVQETFWQSVASKLAWVMLAVTATATLLALSVRVVGDPAPVAAEDLPFVLPESEILRLGFDQLARDGVIPKRPDDPKAVPAELRARALEAGRRRAAVDGVRPLTGSVSFGFGAVEVPIARPRGDLVRFVQGMLAATAADTAGVLLALLWTAGFLPTFLEPQSATVFLTKPTPRWLLYLGKYFGVVLFVALQATLFIGCTWVALGVRTGVWTGAYWLAVPLLAFNFAVFYAVSAYLAVWTRSTVVALFGTLLFWLLCWVVNYVHLRLIVAPPAGVGSAAELLHLGYWLLPKPLDLGGIFFEALGAADFSTKVPELAKAQEMGHFYPEWSVATSALFAAGALGLGAYELEMTDY